MYNEFSYKSYCELIITSDKILPDEITFELGIQPYRSFKRGDKTTSNHTSRTGEKMINLWAIRTQEIEQHNEDITAHISQLRDMVRSGYKQLLSYKKATDIDISIWFWIETDDAGVGLCFADDQLKFINELSNNMRLSIICSNA